MNLSFPQVAEGFPAFLKGAAKKIEPLKRSTQFGAMLFSRTPFKVQENLIGPLLNHALQPLIDEGELDFLNQKTCAIAVKNTDQVWVFSLVENRLILIKEMYPDVTISATVPAFLELVSKQSDPDALFFQRKLSIDGNVELGLHVKNMLDALDEEDLPKIWQKTLTQLRAVLNIEAAAT